ncbi:ketosteroid isomerase-like protein [Actinomadura algeriensis]|uniref:Ketosteroid isomerase-like protein n=1 Tax=Actinomadura algeriensis TaxID=1679523 RepID=A0ABR9JQA9_9ACTN|nr:DUF4440 domain-containing protein [Actinomadura algeriensis]MBE1532751.1 ketosteroid isomerase-like protein [Actinomadura algeriensis]
MRRAEFARRTNGFRHPSPRGPAARVRGPGRAASARTASGRDGPAARLQSLGAPITVRPRHCHTTGDLALLIVDWTIEGTGPDGEPVHIRGTATDVARRGNDGYWRYAIDNPFGVDDFEGPTT